MGKPAVKSTRKLAKAAENAKLAAIRQDERVRLKQKGAGDKQLGAFITFLEQHIDKVPEWGAIAIGTLIVKPIVTQASETLTAYNGLITRAQSGKGLASMIAPLSPFQAASQWVIEQVDKSRPAQSQNEIPEWFLWCVSFFISYMMVKHAGQIIGGLEKGLGAIVPKLLGGL